jgi:hypothetical protein
MESLFGLFRNHKRIFMSSVEYYKYNNRIMGDLLWKENYLKDWYLA